MRRIILSIAVVLVLVSTAAGQITIDSEFAPYRPIVATLDLPDATDGTQTIARWTVNAERIILDEGRVVHIWAPPGKYAVRCEVITVNWTEQHISFDEHTATFTVTGKVPDDPPDPDDPVVQTIFVTILEESADRTLEQARIYTSDTFNSYFDGGHKFRTVDDDVVDENGDTPEDIATILSHADSLPWLVIQGVDGTVLWDGPPPADEAATLDLLKKYGGE